MPLHDWTDLLGWEGVHHLWMTELLRWVKPRLPAGYRVYIGSAPTVAVGGPPAMPDESIWHLPEERTPPAHGPSAPPAPEPDEEMGVARIEPSTALYVERRGRLVTVVELTSPRNKDWGVARMTALGRYIGCLLEGVHLLLVDVHRRPLAFSVADQITRELHVTQPPLPAPYAVAYRVGEPAASAGSFLAIWRRPLTVSAPLPLMALPISTEISVPVDLEQTYMRAATDAYL
jgi:hypothetical protein